MPTSTFEQAAVERGIKSLPLQRALALLTVTHATVTGTKSAETRNLHSLYEVFCEHIDAKTISERRFRDKASTILPIPVFWRKPRRAVARGLGKTNRYELEVKAETVLDNLADESRVVDIITDMLRPKMNQGDGGVRCKTGRGCVQRRPRRRSPVRRRNQRKLSGGWSAAGGLEPWRLVGDGRPLAVQCGPRRPVWARSLTRHYDAIPTSDFGSELFETMSQSRASWAARHQGITENAGQS